MKILNGKIIAEKILKNVKTEILKKCLKPKAAVISVAKNKATKIYLRKKLEAANKVDIDFQIFEFQNSSQDELITLIQKLNQDEKYCGILVQLPLPKNFDTKEILSFINSRKDIDGLAAAVKNQFSDHNFISPTAQSIIEILNYYVKNWQNNAITIIGKGILVGLPLIYLMKQQKVKKLISIDENSQNKLEKIKNADIIISATGIADLVSVDQIKQGAILIDCGSPLSEINQKNISQKAKMLTPVPGGIGPVSVAILMRNIIEARRLNSKFKSKKVKPQLKI
jgi:methylenetetrahydrofolate dehydrogenase (NADP+)/methenyltetrahydrofolate cyclohydrolase